MRGSLPKFAKKGDTWVESEMALLAAMSHTGSQWVQSSWKWFT